MHLVTLQISHLVLTLCVSHSSFPLLNREKNESTGQSSILHLLAAALLTPVPKKKTLLKEKFQYKKDIFTQEEPEEKILKA